jgi:hypothetical protein
LSYPAQVPEPRRPSRVAWIPWVTRLVAAAMLVVLLVVWLARLVTRDTAVAPVIRDGGYPFEEAAE